ncbi:MAG: HPr family phosphocarrier protein [Anaerolineales bacterium]
MTTEIQLTLENEVGLHARPASLFVKQASGFTSEVTVRNISDGTEWVDAKSILSILTLGAEQGHEIEIRATGEDEEEAIQALEHLVRSNFSDHQNQEEGEDEG